MAEQASKCHRYDNNSDTLTNSLSYLNEVQHNILETYQEDLEAVLVNAYVEDEDSTRMVANSIAMRI